MAYRKNAPGTPPSTGMIVPVVSGSSPDTSTYAATNLFTFDLLSGLYTYTVGTGLPSGSYTLTFTFANGWKKVCLINKLL